MANKAIRLGDTGAADVNLDDVRNWVSFVKLDSLIEVPFYITSAKIVPSNFDPSHTTAKVQFEYVENVAGELDDTDEEETVYEFSTEQRAIKAQVQKWIDQNFPFGENTIGPVTITAYGQANARGSYPLCIADVIEELDEPAPVRKDMRQDATRQILAGKSTVNTAAQARTVVNPRKSIR